MKSVRRIARAMGITMVSIITALVITVLCAPEEDRTELAGLVENLAGQGVSEKLIDWDSLPDEVIAWVEVPGTNIDEPIVQATLDAPSAYLYRDALGQGAYGTPYIDSECSIDSRFVMVFGHHMSDGSVFADFANFSNKDYAREHNRIIVYKRNDDALELEVCAVDVVDASRERLVIDQESDFKQIVESGNFRLSGFDEARQLFAFATCSYQAWNSRTVVFAFKA